jgi:hypothetical protein
MWEDRMKPDKAYIAAREALIPKAERMANHFEGEMKSKGQTEEDYARRWNGCFHSQMRKMVREAGI